MLLRVYTMDVTCFKQQYTLYNVSNGTSLWYCLNTLVADCIHIIATFFSAFCETGRFDYYGEYAANARTSAV